jgi:hypothetical protein
MKSDRFRHLTAAVNNSSGKMVPSLLTRSYNYFKYRNPVFVIESQVLKIL